MKKHEVPRLSDLVFSAQSASVELDRLRAETFDVMTRYRGALAALAEALEPGLYTYGGVVVEVTRDADGEQDAELRPVMELYNAEIAMREAAGLKQCERHTTQPAEDCRLCKREAEQGGDHAAD